MSAARYRVNRGLCTFYSAASAAEYMTEENIFISETQFVSKAGKRGTNKLIRVNIDGVMYKPAIALEMNVFVKEKADVTGKSEKENLFYDLTFAPETEKEALKSIFALIERKLNIYHAAQPQKQKTSYGIKDSRLIKVQAPKDFKTREAVCLDSFCMQLGKPTILLDSFWAVIEESDNSLKYGPLVTVSTTKFLTEKEKNELELKRLMTRKPVGDLESVSKKARNE